MSLVRLDRGGGELGGQEKDSIPMNLVFLYEPITLLASQVRMNVQFGTTSCGLHQSSEKTWLDCARTVLSSVLYEPGVDQVSQHGVSFYENPLQLPSVKKFS